MKLYSKALALAPLERDYDYSRVRFRVAAAALLTADSSCTGRVLLQPSSLCVASGAPAACPTRCAPL